MLLDRIKTLAPDLVANFIVVGFFIATMLADTGLSGGPLAKVDSEMFRSLVSVKTLVLAALGALAAFVLFKYVANTSKLRSHKRRGNFLASRVLAQLSSVLAGFGSLSFFVAYASDTWAIALGLPAAWLAAILVAPPAE
jgi:hypothetical protein